MPEYYLTNAELEILTLQAAGIHRGLGFESGYNIIELGAGDGMKTKAFLQYLVNNNIDVTYMPLDISQEAMNILESDLSRQMPQLEILDVRYTGISIFPKAFLKLTGLKELWLNYNPIAKIPEGLGQFKQLQVLGLAGINLKKLPEDFDDRGMLVYSVATRQRSPVRVFIRRGATAKGQSENAVGTGNTIYS